MGTYLNGKKGNKKRTYKGSNLNMTKQKKNDVVIMNFRRGGRREGTGWQNFMDAGTGYTLGENSATAQGTWRGHEAGQRRANLDMTSDVAAGIDKSQFAGATQGSNTAQSQGETSIDPQFNMEDKSTYNYDNRNNSDNSFLQFNQPYSNNTRHRKGGRIYLNKQEGGSLKGVPEKNEIHRKAYDESHTEEGISPRTKKLLAIRNYQSKKENNTAPTYDPRDTVENRRMANKDTAPMVIRDKPYAEMDDKDLWDNVSQQKRRANPSGDLDYVTPRASQENRLRYLINSSGSTYNGKQRGGSLGDYSDQEAVMDRMGRFQSESDIAMSQATNRQYEDRGAMNSFNARPQQGYGDNSFSTGLEQNQRLGAFQKGGTIGFQDGGDYEEFINSDRVSKGYQKYAKRKEAKKQRYLNDYIPPKVLPEDVEELYFGDPTVTEFKDSDYKKELDEENRESSSKNTWNTDMHNIRDKHSPKTKTQKAIDASNASANDGFVDRARWESQRPFAGDSSSPQEYITPSEVEDEIIDDGTPIDSKTKKTLKSLGQSASTIYNKGREGASEMNKDGRLANDIIGNIGRFEDVRAGKDAIRKMRDLETPYADVQGVPKLKAANYDAARRGVDDQIRSSNKATNSQFVGAPQRAAAKAAAMGSGFKAKGDLWDKEHRLNAQIKNQQASMSANITARNIANKLEGDKREFMKQADLIAMTQENRKTKGSKFEAIARDMNLKKDKRISNKMEVASSDPRTAKLLSNKLDEQEWFDAYGTTKADYFNMTPAEQAEQVKQYQAIQSSKKTMKMVEDKEKDDVDKYGNKFQVRRSGGVLNTLKSAGYFK
jgi:hypothetical protein